MMTIDEYHEERNIRTRCVELAAHVSHDIIDQIRNAQYIYDFICEGCALIDSNDLKKFGIDIKNDVSIDEQLLAEETEAKETEATFKNEPAGDVWADLSRDFYKAFFEIINRPSQSDPNTSLEKTKVIIDNLMENREITEVKEYFEYLGRKFLDGFKIPPSKS